jgi:hypothetical protein
MESSSGGSAGKICSNILNWARVLLKANGLKLRIKHFKRPSQAVLALLLAGLVLLLDAMAACPELHELIHHDADQPGHECAVTMFAHGQVDSSVATVATILPVAPVEFSPLTLVSLPNAQVETFPPGRGPPASLLPA